MKNTSLAILILLTILGNNVFAQETNPTEMSDSTEVAHSILPVDGIIQYLPHDTLFKVDALVSTSGKIRFTPMINFFFRPEGTFDYKEAGLPIDTGHLNFYLR